MKRNKLAKTILTFGLSAAMVMGTGAMAFAATEFTADTNNNAYVNKSVTYAKGVTVPEQTFTFKFEQQKTESAPATADIDNVSVTISGLEKIAAASSNESVTSTAKKSDNIDFSKITKTGTYEYKVTETAIANDPDAQGYGWQTNNEEYTMLVAKHANGDVSYVIKDSAGNKIDSLDDFLFKNTYTKRGGNDTTDNDNDGDGTQDSLVISKVVSASDAPDQTFNFTITFTKSATESSLPSTFTAYRVTGTDTAGKETVEISTTGDNAGEFTLTKGQKLVFNDIPAGTTYTVKESGAAEYTATVSGKSDGTDLTGNNLKGTKGEDFTSPTMLIGEGLNNITFTNDVTDVSITGLALNAAPFVAVIGLGLALLAAYVVMRRRRYNQ